jgi:hypothetical protein
MSGSLLARGLLAGLALSFLVAPAALADDPGTTTTTTTTETTTTTVEPTTTESATTETTTTQATNTGTTTADATTTEPTVTEETAPAPNPWAETARTRRLRARALHYRTIARRWRALMGDPRPYLHPPARPFVSLLDKRRRMARRWHVKAARARRAGHHPPHLGAWLCIHRYEGAWHDPYAPYYGGLQMDLTFQQTYGPRLLRRKGTADHWTRFEQMWVAERALRAGRGFYPWPVAARYCGLI